MASKKQTVISRPIARSERLLVETVGDETVIYDLELSVAHALKPLAAAAFMYADGERTLAEIAELASYRLDTQVTETDVKDAVEQLHALDLLETPELELGRGGFSRRDALKVFAATGAGTVLVSSIAAPFASADITGNGIPYACGTGDTGIQDANGYHNVSNSGVSSWPQPYADDGGTIVAAGSPGGPTSSSYSTNGSKAWTLGYPCVVTASTASNCKAKVGSTNENISGVPSSSVCDSGGYCVTTSFAYDSSHTTKTSCTNAGHDWVSSGGDWTAGTTGVSGTYEGVPCDGSAVGASYQCLEVVCVPSSVGVVTGAVDSGSILTTGQGDTNGYNDSKPVGGGYGQYTELACNIWGNTFCNSYPYKWCTNNPCVKSGTCKQS